MKKKLKTTYGWLAAWLCAALATGCSTTRNLPEEEVLYTGIQDIDYGEKSRKKGKG